MRKLSIFILTCVSMSWSWSQDFHMTQILQSPNLINPGAIGVYNGWERIILQHRNQWLGGSTTFMSSGVAVDANFLKNEYRPNAHFAVGLQFYNDQAGSSKYGLQLGSLGINGILPIGGGHQLSLGLQVGMGFRHGNNDALIYDSQWNSNQYDPTILSGETGTLSTFNYIDASSGIYYQYDASQSTFARNKETKIEAGFAVYHINAPEMKYRTGSSEKLARKYVGTARFSSDIGDSKFAMDAQFVQFIQGGHYESILGLILRRRISDGSKQTGFNQDAFVGLGVYSRFKDAISPTLQVDWKGFHFGVTYDITYSTLRYGYKGGSLEFSLGYTNLKHALFKSRRNSFR